MGFSKAKLGKQQKQSNICVSNGAFSKWLLEGVLIKSAPLQKAPWSFISHHPCRDCSWSWILTAGSSAPLKKGSESRSLSHQEGIQNEECRVSSCPSSPIPSRTRVAMCFLFCSFAFDSAGAARLSPVYISCNRIHRPRKATRVHTLFLIKNTISTEASPLKSSHLRSDSTSLR